MMLQGKKTNEQIIEKIYDYAIDFWDDDDNDNFYEILLLNLCERLMERGISGFYVDKAITALCDDVNVFMVREIFVSTLIEEIAIQQNKYRDLTFLHVNFEKTV